MRQESDRLDAGDNYAISDTESEDSGPKDEHNLDLKSESTENDEISEIINIKISDDETDKGYNEFIKEYGSRYEWNNEGNPEFIPKCTEELRKEIWPDGIDKNEIKIDDNADEVNKFRYGLLLQDEDLIVDYYSKIKRCNNVIKLCKNHLRQIFHKGLSSESQRYIERFGCYYSHNLDPDKMVEMLIQAEKENAPDFITAFSDCLRQVSNVHILTQSGFSNNNFISTFLNLELIRPSMAGGTLPI
ncbi:unnamed protein product [Rhizophagus irregularis]|nr:unnamed protein product [Rhizophagus irregularis]